MMLIVLTTTLLAVISFTNLKIDKTLTQELLNKAHMQAQLAAEYTKMGVINQSREQVELQLNQLSKFSSVYAAVILLSNESIIGYYPNQDALSFVDVSNKHSLSQTEDYQLTIAPIMQDSKLIGHAYVYHDLDKLYSHELNNIIFFILIFLVIWLMSMQLAKHFQKRMFVPITHMLAHIKDIYQSGNFEKRLVSYTQDEMGELTNGFNQILETVQKRENELTLHSQRLRKLVDVRTDQLNKKAHYDSLTNLPNRYLLVDRLRKAISKAKRTHSILAVLFLDLDRFKVINDNLGHQNGDLLLKETARRLKKVSRNSDTVARLGGDEFVFLLEDLSSPEDPVRTAIRIIRSFEKPFLLEEHILHISTSIGISVYPTDGLDYKTLLQNADISMYHAKREGTGQYSFYSGEMNDSSLERLKIESNLRTAIANNEFYLMFQPQLNLNNNQCKNVEALLRWKNSEVGEMSPGIYVPIAEETGMINQIDLWVIEQTCKQIRLWREHGLEEITVAVNISAGHLMSDTLLHFLIKHVELNNVKPSQIEIEITEAVFVKHTERTIKSLHAFKALGFKIAIDDFGTGYSSLQYIQDFPTDTLKLDGMFIRDLENNKMSQGIVCSTIILAHSLGLELVTECVEDEYQLEFLRKNGCDLIQGYFYSKPLTPDLLVEFIENQQ
jgi:diguanylate cyclase (GGDEF)-like protein